MRKYQLKCILISMLFFYKLGSFPCQEIDKSKAHFSVEPIITYPYYIMLDRYTIYSSKLNYNYGYGILLSINTKRTAIKSGAWYSTKEYYQNTSSYSQTINRIDYHIDYLQIPTICSIRLSDSVNGKKQFYFSTGFIYTYAYRLKSITHYKNETILSNNNLSFHSKIGVSLRVGLSYIHHFSEHWSVFTDIYFDPKLIMEYEKNQPSHFGVETYELPEDRITSGINIGVAYYLKNTGTFSKWIEKNK